MSCAARGAGLWARRRWPRGRRAAEARLGRFLRRAGGSSSSDVASSVTVLFPFIQTRYLQTHVPRHSRLKIMLPFAARPRARSRVRVCCETPDLCSESEIEISMPSAAAQSPPAGAPPASRGSPWVAAASWRSARRRPCSRSFPCGSRCSSADAAWRGATKAGPPLPVRGGGGGGGGERARRGEVRRNGARPAG